MGDIPPSRAVEGPGRAHYRDGHPWATVLNPGSFDPIHLGHLDVIEQAAELFGHVIVAVMYNHEKTAGCSPSRSGSS